MKNFLVASVCLVATVQALQAVDLTPETTAGFDAYIASFEARRLKAGEFIRSDSTPQRRQQLLHGDVVTFPATNPNGETPVKGGLIHDWIGAIFVPGTDLKHALSVIQDYPNQKVVYAPDIADSKLRARRGQDEFDVYIRLVKSKLMISDVLNTEHAIRFVTVTPNQVYCRSYSTRIAEVSNPGSKNEHELPVGKDRGLLWRMYGYWFFEQRDGGVQIEYESITLSRDIPFLMSKILGPVLHGLPAESMRTSLDKTRKAIMNTAAKNTDHRSLGSE